MIKKIRDANNQSVDERRTVITRLYEKQGNRCYVCLKPIELTANDPQTRPELDHIDPRAHLEEKAEQFDNYAVEHGYCNKKKKTMGLDLARAIVWLEDIKKTKTETYLSDVEEARQISPKKVHAKLGASNTIDIRFGASSPITCPVFEDPVLKGCRYFYGQIPLEYIAHDRELQPRPLGDQIDRFLRGMHKQPILDVGHSRLTLDASGFGQITLWNAQHRAVVSILTSRRTLDLKVYLNPTQEQIKILRSANADAHTTLRQVASPAPNAAQRYAAIFEDRWNSFMLDDRFPKKTEEGFIESQPDAASKQDVKRMLEKNVIIDATLRSDDDSENPIANKIRAFTDYESTRSAKKLFTYNSIQKGVITVFAHMKPLNVDVANVDPDDNPRLIERDNLVHLLNIIAEELIEGKWTEAKGAKVQKNNPGYSQHNAVVMLTRPIAMQVWSRVLKDSIVKTCTIIGSGMPSTTDMLPRKRLLLEINDENLFLHNLPDEIWDAIRRMVRKLGSHQVWSNPTDQMLNVLTGNNLVLARTLLHDGILDEKKIYDAPLNESYLLT